jgi:hypothetical protein
LPISCKLSCRKTTVAQSRAPPRGGSCATAYGSLERQLGDVVGCEEQALPRTADMRTGETVMTYSTLMVHLKAGEPNAGLFKDLG